MNAMCQTRSRLRIRASAWWFGFGAFGGALGLYVGGKIIEATGSFKMAIILDSVSAIFGFILDCFLKPARKIEGRK
jgi:hypothetical protein